MIAAQRDAFDPDLVVGLPLPVCDGKGMAGIVADGGSGCTWLDKAL